MELVTPFGWVPTPVGRAGRRASKPVVPFTPILEVSRGVAPIVAEADTVHAACSVSAVSPVAGVGVGLEVIKSLKVHADLLIAVFFSIFFPVASMRAGPGFDTLADTAQTSSLQVNS